MDIYQQLEIKVALKILRPVTTVFEAIADPDQMCNYFIATSSGRVIEGTTICWTFPEMNAVFPVQVKKVAANESILYSWKDMNGVSTDVRFTLDSLAEEETFVTINEGKKELSGEGLIWPKCNTEGWANFLCCLKA